MSRQAGFDESPKKKKGSAVGMICDMPRIIDYRRIQAGCNEATSSKMGQLSSCAPGKYPVDTRNSLTISPPVKTKVRLNSLIHSSFERVRFASSQPLKEPYS